MEFISNGRGNPTPADSFSCIAAGTMVTKDLAKARTFYREFLGFDCVRYAPQRMLIRDRASKFAMEHGQPKYMVIEVQEVAEITHPQNFLNHWGLTVASTTEVDRIHHEAETNKAKYRISKVRKITQIHAAYGFYFADEDMNWWEVECRTHGRTNEMVFDEGDYDAQSAKATNAGPDGRLVASDHGHKEAPSREDPGVVGDAVLTHGTLESRDLVRARAVYEDILGLRCVRHSPPAQLIAGQGDVAVVCVGSGDALHEQASMNRWEVLMGDAAAVTRAYRRATEKAGDLRMLAVGNLSEQNGVQRFLLQDGDSNWWEVSNLPRDYYQAIFKLGDV
jgi:catechol 2,3-dioxygenase-like lactoylglutathione lyase family enzyme